jgi:cobalt/nickel transport system ATP-binding protein
LSCSITLKNLSLARNGEILFENVTLSVGHKDKIAVMGPNGAGKTTLLKSIVGLCKVKSGTIEIFHHELVSEDDFRKARGHIGFVFQDSDDQIIAPTVIEEVAFGMLNNRMNPAEAQTQAEAMLSELGILHLRDRITLHLSGGEKKLVTLASVLVMRPDILLLDEPSAGLDEKSVNHLAHILASIDKSMLIVSHDLDFVNKMGAKIMNLTREGLK